MVPLTYTEFLDQVAGGPSAEECVNPQKNHAITLGCGDSVEDTLVNEGLQSQNSFGVWMNNAISDIPCSADTSALESSIASSGHDSFSSLLMDNNQQPSLSEQVFHLTEVAPAWASSTEKTKVSFCFLSYVCLLPFFCNYN